MTPPSANSETKAKEFFFYDSGTHLFYSLKDGGTLGRMGADITFPDDDDMDVIHLRFSVQDGMIKIIDVSANEERVRVNTFPIQKNEPRKVGPGDLVAVGSRRFILTIQNQYRPMLMAATTDKTLVRATDQTVLLPETIIEHKQRAVDAKRRKKSEATSRARESRRKFFKPLIPIVLAAGVAYLVLSDPDGAIRTRLRRAKAPAEPKPDLSWSQPQSPAFKEVTKPNRLVLPAEAGAVTVVNGGTGETYWEAYRIDGAPADVVYIKNVSVLGRRAPFAAMRESDLVLRQFLKMPIDGWNLPLGEQKEAEAAANSGCMMALKSPQRIPTVPIQQVIEDVITGMADLVSETQDPRGGPLPEGYFTTRLSTIRFPLLDSKIELTSVPVRCEDPAGSRIRFAQQRATLFHAVKTRAAFANRLTKQEAERVRTITHAAAIEALHSTRLSSLIKGCRNLIRQATAFSNWAPTQAWKDAGLQLGGYLTDDIAELSKQYFVGLENHPAYYPPIKPDAYLQDGDLLFLSAY